VQTALARQPRNIVDRLAYGVRCMRLQHDDRIAEHAPLTAIEQPDCEAFSHEWKLLRGSQSKSPDPDVA
jgi:hypothetical protein